MQRTEKPAAKLIVYGRGLFLPDFGKHFDPFYGKILSISVRLQRYFECSPTDPSLPSRTLIVKSEFARVISFSM